MYLTLTLLMIFTFTGGVSNRSFFNTESQFPLCRNTISKNCWEATPMKAISSDGPKLKYVMVASPLPLTTLIAPLGATIAEQEYRE
jgi:hypothetical protein